MAYVPQFIPTNTEVLQGTLNQYQQASDLETNRQNQVSDTYSAIPTSQIDTADKNAVMGQFNKVREELDKKYNYDRSNSQYASELASKITQLRSNPLWGHLQKKEELNKMRQQLIATKGADYYENFNPEAITVKDANKLQEWKPVDLKDVREAAALAAKEHAKSIYATTFDKKSQPGYIFRTEHVGYKDTNQASQYLNSPQGDAWLKQSIASRGFDPNDPVMYKEAYTAALSNLVGTEKTDNLIDYDYRMAQEEAAKKKAEQPTGIPLVNTGNFGEQRDYGVKDLADAYSKQDELKTLRAIPEDKLTPDQSARADALQYDLEKYQSVLTEKMNSPVGQRVQKRGMDLIKEKYGLTGEAAQAKYDELINYFTKTNAAQRSFEGGAVSGVLNTVGEGISMLANTERVAKNAIKAALPWTDKDKAAEGITSAVQNIAKAIDEKEDEGDHDLSKVHFAMNEATDKLATKYANPTEYKKMMLLNDAEKQKLFYTEFYKAYRNVKEFNKFYKAKGDYFSDGFANIERPLNEDLAKGETVVYQKYAFAPGTKDATTKPYFDFAVDHLEDFDVYEVSRDKDKRDTKKTFEQASKVRDALKADQVSGSFAFERESEPQIILTGKDGKQYKLKMDLNKMSTEVAMKYAEDTGRIEFLDGRFKDIKFSERAYRPEDKDGYLRNVLKRTFGENADITKFNGIEVSQQKIGRDIVYTLYHPSLGNQDPIQYGSKSQLMFALNKIYNAQ
jgi:hypothetical protein